MNAGSRSWTRAMLNEWPSSMGKIKTMKKAESLLGSLERFQEAVRKVEMVIVQVRGTQSDFCSRGGNTAAGKLKTAY